MNFRKAVLSLVSMKNVFMNRAARRKMAAIKKAVARYSTKADRKYGYPAGTVFGRVMSAAFPEKTAA
jgi:hypothetical protein